MEDYHPDPNKPTILIVSDSAGSHSGLSRVVRAIFGPIAKKGNFNIIQLAWYDRQGTPEEIPWPIIQTRKDGAGVYMHEDKWGQLTFPDVISKYSPDIVFGFGDPWSVEHIASSPLRARYDFIAYCCIDSEPIADKYHGVFKEANTVVTFGKWAQQVLQESAGVDSEIIPHGVDTEVFYPCNDAYLKLRAALDVGPEHIVIGTVARNQPRKNLGIMFEYIHRLKYGRFATCDECGRVTCDTINPCTRATRVRASKCKWCLSDNVTHAEADTRWIWYYHGAVKDVGWDFRAFADRYAISDILRFNAGVKPVHGVNNADLNSVYNGIDIFSMPTTCEGFGLPILEAMSAGTPVVVPDYSAYVDWAPAGGLMVDVASWYIDFQIEAVRAYLSMEHWIEQTLKLTNPIVRSELGDAARKKALEYDWKDIVPMWEDLFTTAMTGTVSTDNWRRTSGI